MGRGRCYCRCFCCHDSTIQNTATKRDATQRSGEDFQRSPAELFLKSNFFGLLAFQSQIWEFKLNSTSRNLALLICVRT